MDEFYYKYCTDESAAKSYIEKIRWGKYASCPYCNNNKAYFIENGRRYKCANKNCHKKFSVTVKTLMEASNIPLLTWLKCVWKYSINMGNCEIWDLEKTAKISPYTAKSIKEKLDFSWGYVMKEWDSLENTIKDLIQCLLNLYDKKNNFKSNFILDEFDNISDINQYRKLVKYTQWWLKRAYWLDTAQITPEDLIAETFLYMSDNKIKEYNAESVSFFIRKVSGIMLREWSKEQPEYRDYMRNYNTEWQRKNRRCLGKWYVTSKLKRSYPDKTFYELKMDNGLMNKKRERIIDFRKKYNILYDFNSHFD